MSVTVNLDDVEMGYGELRPYSGRGMYGKECLALFGSIDNLIEYVKVVAQEIYSYPDDYMDHPLWDFYEELGNVSTDSMGLFQVFYWRGIKVEDDSQ